MSAVRRLVEVEDQAAAVDLDQGRDQAAALDRARVTAAARAEYDRVLHAARVEDRRRRRADRADQLTAAAAAVRRVARVVVPLVPLVAVNTLAVTGQLGFALDHLAGGLPVAVTFAVALESMAVFVGWHASLALRRGDSAAGLQASAYALAAVVAAVNYGHYSGAGFAPTATAVAFALVSLVSPWLWRIHSRAAHRDTLAARGEIDTRGVRLSTARKLWHPVRSLRVMSWAAWSGETQPAAAVAGWEAAAAGKGGKPADPAKPAALATRAALADRATRAAVEPAAAPVAQLPAGSDRSEVGSDRSEVGSDRSEVGSDRSDQPSAVEVVDLDQAGAVEVEDQAAAQLPAPVEGAGTVVPSVPDAAALAVMTAAEVKAAARSSLHAAAGAGVQLSAETLAAAYGKSARWGRDRRAEIRGGGGAPHTV